jgi:hypothetical protein
MPTNKLYHTFMCQICELRPKQRVTQIRNFVWLLVGIFESRSVTLSKIAGKIPGPATLVSITRRISRFLENPAVRVREWYHPIARNWLQAQLASIGEIRLILDGTKVGFGHQLLMVSMAYRKRAVPIAWTWVRHVRGHSTAHKQLALLSYVKILLPAGAEVFVLGDCEFGSVEVLKWLEEQPWWYVLRQKTDTCLWSDTLNEWKPFSAFIQKAGQSFWLGAGYLTTQEIHPTNLLAHWEKGEEEPWFLATNLADRSMTLKYYRFRAWCEEMHGDLNKHGFDLESTLLHDFEKLSRLTLAVALLYVWLITVGGRTIQDGLRHLVDRHDRRDLSIFQIGLRSVQRSSPMTCLSIFLFVLTYELKLSGS